MTERSYASPSPFPPAAPPAGRKLVTALELLIFAALCLYRFGPFTLPLSGTVLMLAFAAYSLGTRNLRFRDVGFARPESWGKTLAGGALAAVLFLLASLFVILPLATKLTGKPIDLSLFQDLHGNTGALLQSLAIAWTSAAFAEEMIFRGYLMNRIADLVGRDAKGWAVALLASGAIFGSAHYYQGVTGMINAGTLGILIGLVYLAFRRQLAAAIVCHGLIDSLFFLMVYLSLEARFLK
jgi:membrane protease YdiL (CAAX protease family)